jgi:hypothetical protein
MNACFITVSFELNEGKLEDWKKMSAEIDRDISSASGFISRDSGIDENGLVYCLIKWRSKVDQKSFSMALEARKDWPEILKDFERICNMKTMKNQTIALF